MFPAPFLALSGLFAGLFSRNTKTAKAPWAREPQRKFKPYTDKVGMPHGLPGSKLVRKVMSGTITLRHGRGSFYGLTLNPVPTRKRQH